MIFSTISWSMSIESKAADDDYVYTSGTWNVTLEDTRGTNKSTVSDAKGKSVNFTASSGYRMFTDSTFNLDSSISGHVYFAFTVILTVPSSSAGNCGFDSNTTSFKFSNLTGATNLIYKFEEQDISSTQVKCTVSGSFDTDVAFNSLQFSNSYQIAPYPSLNNSTSVTFQFVDALVYQEPVPRTEKEILEDIDEKAEESLEEQKEQTETQKGIFASIVEFFSSFFGNLIDAVIGLFVPSDEEMSDLLSQLNEFFSDTFGFLYAPFDWFIQLVNALMGDGSGTALTFPGFSIMGQTVWEEQTYDIASDSTVSQIFGYVRTGTGVIIVFAFIMYLQDFFKERFGKG